MKGKITMQCNFCGTIFQKKIPKSLEVKCPKCKEEDVDIIFSVPKIKKGNKM